MRIYCGGCPIMTRFRYCSTSGSLHSNRRCWCRVVNLTMSTLASPLSRASIFRLPDRRLLTCHKTVVSSNAKTAIPAIFNFFMARPLQSSNDAAQWRAAADARYETETLSARPLQQKLGFLICPPEIRPHISVVPNQRHENENNPVASNNAQRYQKPSEFPMLPSQFFRG